MRRATAAAVRCCVLLATLLTLTFAATAAQPPAASAAAWDSFPSCPPAPHTTKAWYQADVRCLGHRVMRTRGRIKGECMQEALPAGTIYPNAKFCGGNGPETIAQARAIANLGFLADLGQDMGPPGERASNAQVHWEVQLPDVIGRRTRADIVDDSATPEVYEVKRTNNWGAFLDPQRQAEGYRDALNRAGVTPAAKLAGTVASSNPSVLPADIWLVAGDNATACEIGVNRYAPRYDVYYAAMFMDGVYGVYNQTLECFDPSREAPPLPVKNPIWNGIEMDVSAKQWPDLHGKLWHPFPGTTLTTAEFIGGGGGGGTGFPSGSGADGSGESGGSGSGGTGGGGAGSGGGSGGFVSVHGSGTGATAGNGTASGPGAGAGSAGGNGSSSSGSTSSSSSSGETSSSNSGQTIIIDNGSSAGVRRDPHMTTFDGLAYDLQSIGEFELAESDALGLDVQVRLVRFADDTSVAGRAAMSVNGRRVELDANGTAYVDGTVVDVPNNGRYGLYDGAYITRNNNNYTVVWPGDGARPSLSMLGNQVSLSIPRTDDLQGLLGNDNGNPADDLQTSWGEQLASTVSPSTIHGTYADSWRVSDDTSLFTYAPGEDTDTYTDKSFPAQIRTIDNLSDEDLAAGTAVCADAGVRDGRQFDDCIVDWALTKNYDFIQAAAQEINPVTELGARAVDATGAISEDFDGTIAANFKSPRYATGAGSGTFAGPFSRDGRYVFYVPNLPAHDQATVNLNLIAFGDWSPFDGSAAHVTINGQVAWQENLAQMTPSRTGTTASGKPYSVYPVTVTVPHIDGQLNVGVDAGAPLGSDRAVGVDDVSAQLDLVPPQHFATTLPLHATDGVPATGAGNIETPASEDIYNFTVAHTGNVQIDVSHCSANLSNVHFKLISDATGGVVADRYTCGSELFPDVAAGAYHLSVTNTGRSGTYDLSVEPQPDPDAIPVTLPVTATDGVPLAGAGKLETTSSEDDYAFTAAARSALEIKVSDCATTLGGYVHWKLLKAADRHVVADSWLACDSDVQPRDLPAGDYLLAIVDNGNRGTYKLYLDAAAPQRFDVTLPIDASDGVPSAGAGNMETAASEDDYAFTVAHAGTLHLDSGRCTGINNYGVRLSLRDESTGATVWGGWSLCQWTQDVPDIAAGDYVLIASKGSEIGTYGLSIAMRPDPQAFALSSLPATITDGVPSTGAGNLEMTSSEDDYTFTTTSTSALELALSDCAGSMNGYIHWILTDRGDGHRVADNWLSCDSDGQQRNLPAGDYKLAVLDDGHKGTYKLQLDAVAPQHFDLTLPFEATADTPATGAGRMESPASEDVYTFPVAATGTLQVDLGACHGLDNYGVMLELTDASGSAVWGGWSLCNRSFSIPDVAAGDYKLTASHGGQTGTYDLGVSVQPLAQSFAVSSFPATITDGVPAGGAGNLETSASEDDYTFSTTAATTALDIAVSECASTLSGGIHWAITDRSDGHAVTDSWLSCDSDDQARNLPAGDYQLAVTDNGHKGTYKLRLQAAVPQHFAVSLPFNASDGVPSAGAGNMETPASEDDYRFAVTAPGTLQVDLGACHGLDNYGVFLVLRDRDSGDTAWSGWSLCNRSFTIPDITTGDYELVASHGDQTGTYAVGLSLVPAPQAFTLTSFPATITDGDPVAGMGNLETTSSEDDYRFTTTTSASLEIAVSDCTGSLGSVEWILTDRSDGHQITYNWLSCGSDHQPGPIPAGDYQLAVVNSGSSGTYKLKLDVVPPQHIALTLPASVSDGSPSAGAGNLESPASQDAYAFTVAHGGDLHVDTGACHGLDNYGVFLSLKEVGSGTQKWGGWSLCNNNFDIADVAAGDYVLTASHGGQTGTYSLGLHINPAPEAFTLTSLPTTITDGDPAAGAGNLETTSSEDDYRFTTTTATTLEIAVSDCTGSLGSVEWILTDRSDGHQVTSNWLSCGSDHQPGPIPAGYYQLAVKNPGSSGTYKLRLDAVATQQFAMTLPFRAAADSPTTGAGKLEGPAARDVYAFTVSAAGTLHFDLGACSGIDNYGVSLSLNDSSGHSVWGGWSLCNRSFTVDVAAGDYTLSATHGGQTGTYDLGVGMVPPAQSFALTSLPATISDGVPATGAGNLEETSSEDDYTFTTTAASNLDVGVSECASALSGYVHWTLTDRSNGHTVSDTWTSCDSDGGASIPAGDYKLAIVDDGHKGTYKLKVDAVTPQRIAATLPFDVSNGSPSAGAGNLETPVSEDDYTFTVATAGTLQIDSTGCTGGLYGLGVSLALVDANGQTKWSGWSFCGWSGTIPDVAAGDYTLRATRGGSTGTYNLTVGMVPPPQSFALSSLPATISDGVPSAGAGNLEVTSSEDDYTFTTTTAGALDVRVSDCASTLAGSVRWVLTDRSDDHTVVDSWISCDSDAGPSIPAGDYKLAIMRQGQRGTYRLRIESVPPQRFDVTLPFSVSNGSPSTGAGNLETPVSEDVYAFTVPTDGAYTLQSTGCSGIDGLGGYVHLLNRATGSEVWQGWSFCGSTANVGTLPAGDYALHFARGGQSGTYAFTFAATS